MLLWSDEAPKQADAAQGPQGAAVHPSSGENKTARRRSTQAQSADPDGPVRRARRTSEGDDQALADPKPHRNEAPHTRRRRSGNSRSETHTPGGGKGAAASDQGSATLSRRNGAETADHEDHRKISRQLSQIPTARYSHSDLQRRRGRIDIRDRRSIPKGTSCPAQDRERPGTRPRHALLAGPRTHCTQAE